MKKLLPLLLTFSISIFAHDEGHGPKLTDIPQKGGVRVSPVVLGSEATLAEKANLVYKAELKKSSDNKKIEVYYYDKEMKALLPVTNLSQEAQATVIFGKGKKQKIENITLKLVGDHYEGILPSNLKKPFNIDVKMSEGTKEFLTAFDNLD